MENIEKELSVPKWLLINRPKIPQMPKNLSAQFVCTSPKVWNFNEKGLHWAAVVRSCYYQKRRNKTQTWRVVKPRLYTINAFNEREKHISIRTPCGGNEKVLTFSTNYVMVWWL